MIFMIEDNGYAISVPVEVNTAGDSISKLVGSFPNLLIQEYDGCDPIASYQAAQAAVDYARRGDGPALLHAHVIRPYSHSMSDDERMYRTAAEREDEAKRDPVHTFGAWLVQRGDLEPGRAGGAARRGGGGVRRAEDAAVGGADRSAGDGALRGLLAGRGPDQRGLRRAARGRGRRREDDGGPDQRGHAGRDAAGRADRGVRRGRRGRVARGADGGRQGQGRGLQGDRGAPARVRRGSCVQLAAGRGQHHRARDRDGDARAQAGGRDPVLRLHLAGVHAASQRALQHALALQQQLQVPDGGAGAHRGLFARRRAVPQPERRGDLYAHPGAAGGDAVQRAGRQRAPADGDPLRRPGALFGAQAPLLPALQPRALPRRGATWCPSGRRGRCARGAT
jgi:hypothetical protein